MARTTFPAIPPAGPTIPQLLATVQALTQAVNLLSINAQPATSQGLTTNAQSFYHAPVLETLTATTGKNTTDVAANTASIDTLNTGVATLNASVTSINTEIITLTADGVASNSAIGTIQGRVGVTEHEISVLQGGIGLLGAVAGGTFTVSGAARLDGNAQYALAVPGADLVDASVTTSKLAANAVSVVGFQASTAGTTATATVVLPDVGTLVIFGAYVAAAALTATPAGVGTLFAKVDGVDHALMFLPSSGGFVLPCQAFLALGGQAAGSHTVVVRAEFSTGPTDLTGVEVVVIGLVR